VGGDDADKDDVPKLIDKGSEGSTKASRRKLVKVESMADREAEDLSVSKYYVSTGNIKGAYLRAQDAVKSMPDDAEAHFALAQTAQKMNQRDQAVTEYKVYLRMDPDGEHMKAARKALAELQ
jgi:Tfp pilus assembly protein PilF